MSSPTWFAVVSQGRSGSTMLCKSLSARPDVFMWDEILHPHTTSRLPSDDGFRRIAHAYQSVENVVDAVGVHLHVTQPSLMFPHWESAWRFIEIVDHLKVIVLSRRNSLEQLASYKIAEMTGLWANQKPIENSRPTVRIDRAELRWFEYAQRAMLQCRISSVPKSRRYEIHYEDMCENWSSRISEIAQFIGVSASVVTPMFMSKQERRPVSEIVENYSDFCQG